MGNYFSFERFITKNFVRALYFLGFVVLTFGGIALATWAGLRLNDASIDRELGWRYVIIGGGAVIIGNLVWRVFCELWIVLFNMHARLVSLDDHFGLTDWVKGRRPASTLNLSPGVQRTQTTTEVPGPTEEAYDSSHPASVLGLT
ncbi:MAG TPA: DUF4282 domain-containing protein [Pyrinomonadaceae bacterium]|nr:DUF4282 domain-containing protein [Pyrinomonadaceae bacterium]